MNEITRGKLIESQRIQFLHLLKRSNDIVLMIDEKYLITGMNSIAQDFYGCGPDDFTGRNLFAVATDYNWQLPASLPTQKLGAKRISWSIIPIPINFQQKGYMLIGQLLEQKVNASQVFLENIIYNVPQYILWKDRNSIFLGCNHNFARLVGLKEPEEIIGKSDYDLGWQADGYTADFIRARDVEVLNGKHLVNLEQYLSLSDDRKIVLLTSKVPLVNERNEIMGVLVVATDITDRKRAEHELMEAKLQAEYSDKAKSEFIANISHDLRTPINSILGVTQILSMRQHTPEQAALITDLNTSAHLLLGLVEDILDFTRLEVGKHEPKYSQFNLRRLISFILKSFNHAYKFKNLNVNLNYDDQFPDYIISDPHYIRRILLNLFGNALKFTEKGSIDIRVRFLTHEKSGTRLQLSVEDTGIGIPSEKLHTIFDRFNRATPAYSSRYEGLGLGLSIAKRLSNILGGTINVVSQQEKGSTFTVDIPCEIATDQSRLSPEMLTQQLNEEEKLAALNEREVRILLVEDDKLSQNVEKALFEEFGCIVDVASNAHEALSKVEKPYDLICMDIGLPDKDGYTLTREIRELEGKGKPVPIVAMTAHVLDRERNKCLEAGMDGFVNKPVTIEEIRRALLDYIF